MFIMKRNEANYSFLLFTIKAQYFAMPIENLVEVTEEVHVSKLPFVPCFIDGLINLNSQIIPQIHAQQLLFSHIKESTLSDSQQTLLVFKSSGPLYALRVGYVLDSITIDKNAVEFFNDENFIASDINYQDHTHAACQSSLIEGKLSYTLDNGATIEALIFSADEAEKIIGDQNNHTEEDETQGFLGELSTQENLESTSTELLIFSINSRLFATALIDILEVIDLDNRQNTQHGLHEGSNIISGLSLVRNNPLAILNLSHWLKISDVKLNQQQSDTVIIISHDDYYCAVAIDAVVGMVNASEEQMMIDPDTQQIMLSLDRQDKEESSLASSNTLVNNSQLNAILSTKDQQQLIEVFSTQKLIESPIFSAIKTLLPKRKDTHEILVKTLDILKFQLHGSTYGILINDIQRVINNHSIEPLLSPKAYILGSCEYDGLVIPVINLSAQLSPSSTVNMNTDNTSLLPRAQQNKTADTIEQEAIVVEFNQQYWAFAIDQSECIIEVKETDIDFLPQRDAQLIKAYASFESSLVNLLNIDSICLANT